MRRTNRGFTFVEILVAMAVFGVLTAVGVPRYRSYKERAYLASMRTELGSLRVAEEAFWAENMAYSADTTRLDWNGSSLVQVAISSSDFAGGFAAVASHVKAPGLQCSTFVGKEATVTASGDIVCSSPSTGAGSGAGVAP